MTDELKNKVVLVTGSSAGIGQATIVEFARLGYQVVVHGTNQDRIDDVAELCQHVSPTKIMPLKVSADLTKPEEVKSLIDAVVSKFNRLDVLVNNAGLYKAFTIEDGEAYEKYRHLMMLNMDHVVHLTSLAVPHLKQSQGCIVNVASSGHTKPLDKGFAYCSAKAALVMFTKCMAIDLAPYKIRVNVVSPGPVATLMPTRSGMPTDLFVNLVGPACLTDRVGLPEEVANVIVFVASDKASFMTGSDVGVDGGCIIKPSGASVGSKK